MSNQEFPYSVSTKRLRDFFVQMQKIGTPDKLNTKVLPSLGFKSTNDRSIIPILKWLELIDATGTPTKYWQSMRNPSLSRQVLAERIQSGYRELYHIFPDAHHRPDIEIRNFIQGQSRAGERAVAAMVTTFRMLCSMADFSASSPGPQAGFSANGHSGNGLFAAPVATPEITEYLAAPTVQPIAFPTLSAAPPAIPQVTINLQIQLPETVDAQYIDSVFASIAKHLCGSSGGSNQSDHEAVP